MSKYIIFLLFLMISTSFGLVDVSLYARNSESIANRESTVFQKYTGSLKIRSIFVVNKWADLLELSKIKKSTVVAPNASEFQSRVDMGVSGEDVDFDDNPTAINNLVLPSDGKGPKIKVAFFIKINILDQIAEITNPHRVFYVRISADLEKKLRSISDQLMP